MEQSGPDSVEGITEPEQVFVIDPSCDERWDAFVATQPLGWMYHTRAWKEILEETFPHIRSRYLAMEERGTGRIAAALPLCLVRSRISGDRLVCLPYATLCDPLVGSAGEFRALVDAAVDLKNELKCKYLEIRGFGADRFMEDERLAIQRDYKHHHLKLDRTRDELLRTFHRTNVRQRIRRAEQSGIEVGEGRDEADLEEFYRLYVKTRRRLFLPPQPYRFLRNQWKKLHPTGWVSLLLGRYNEQAVGAILLFKYKHRVSVEYAVWDEAFARFSPNHLLFWTAIQNACKDGYRIFDFGRTSADHDGLMAFKSRWGTEVTDLITAFFPTEGVRQEGRRGAITHRLIRALCKRLPESALEAFGELCYLHLG